MKSFDLETHLIVPGLLTPPIVCGSVADETPGSETVLSRDEALDVLQQILESDEVLTGANVAYDFGCASVERPEMLPLIFKAYAENRVFDIQIGQFLDSIARGFVKKDGLWDPTTNAFLCDARGRKTNRYSLFTCVRLNLGRTDAKEKDFWRTRYAMLENTPIAEWPGDAVQYPKDDARNTVDVAVYQLANCENLHNMREQSETAFAMHLGAIWGMRVDQSRYDDLSAKVDEIHDVYTKRFQSIGWIKPDGTTNTSALKNAIATAYGAKGTCKRCNGSGKVRSVKTTECRGPKVKARYAGCGGPSCVTCGGRGSVEVLGNEIICRVVADGTGCDGTGLDLSTAPALPRSDKGGVKTDRDALAESADEDLIDFGNNEAEKIRTTYLPFLAGGLKHPINLRPNVLVASGRTSYDMVQQFPRVSSLGNHGCVGEMCAWCNGRGVVGKKETKCPGPPIWGPRACIRARPGRVFCSVDYSAIELCTLAQVCIYTVGGSVMADTINASKDPGRLHTAFAAKMIGVPEDEMVRLVKAGDKKAKDYRQAAKAANFGFPGGMGAAKLVLTKRKKNEGTTTGPDGRKYAGIRFCILLGGAHECGTEKITTWKNREYPPVCKACVEIVDHVLRPAWFAAWPEMKHYFEWVKKQIDQYGWVPCFGPKDDNGQPTIERIRGGVDFTNGANNGFQALASDGGKAAFRALVRESYLDESSPLFGARFPLWLHDESLGELWRHNAHIAGPRQAEVMVREMRRYTPDVWVAAEPALMEFWYKEAEPVYENGILVPWEPKP